MLASGNETDQDVNMGLVYKEFDEIRKSFKVSNFASKSVSRKYAFELDGIPAESDYLKVVYAFSEPEIDPKTEGATFSKIFGCKGGALELFLLKRKLMGPCWIKIAAPTPSPKNVLISS